MSHEASTGSFLVYLRHVSSSAATGFVESAAQPTSLSSIIRNQIVFMPAPVSGTVTLPVESSRETAMPHDGDGASVAPAR